MQARAYVFTSFDLDLRVNEKDLGRIRYLCYGVERCPRTKRVHLQGYVEFHAPTRLVRATRELGVAAHLERRRGTAAEAIAYCAKDCAPNDQEGSLDTALGSFYWVGRRATDTQGARVDLAAVRGLVLDDGLGIGGVIDSGANYTGIRYAEKLLTYRERCRDNLCTVRWYWGGTGTGKTRTAQAESASLATDLEGADSLDPWQLLQLVWWSAGDLRWFDGYDAHPFVILDDFRPESCKLHVLLRLLDRYPFRVECKGGSRQWRPTDIWITCPKHPSECYTDCIEDIEQLIRRIDVIKLFE